jgi:hypothetical protein
MDLSNDDDAPLMDQSQNTQYQHAMLYVVQKCWHSGPIQHVPVDMLRLFHTQREAEEAAYHSAKAFHEAHSKPSSGSLKTLLLPSYPAHNPQGSSYGFLACGGLFWTRALRATMVAAGSNSNNINANTGNMCHSAAYAILTEGVIGGTGNRNSRRGTETCDGRVFGGDATALGIAMEAVARVKANVTNPSVHVDALTVPVGKPVEWLSSGAFVGDWPVQAELGNYSSGGNGNGTTQEVPFGTTPKRQIGFDVDGWGRSISEEMDDDEDNCEDNKTRAVIGGNGNVHETCLVVDCPFEEPVAKRRRVVSVSDEYGDHDMMQ